MNLSFLNLVKLKFKLKFKSGKIKIVSFSSKCLFIRFLIIFCVIISIILSFSSISLKSTLDITGKMFFKGKLKKS